MAPRTLLCGSTWRVGGSVADTGFDELRELTAAAGDHVSLAIAMAGMLMTQTFHHQYRESSRLASEHAELLELIGDPTMTVGLLYGANLAKLEAGEAVEAMQLAQRVIDLAAGDPSTTVDIPASSTANNVSRARSTRIMFPTIAFPSHESLSGSAAGPRDSWRAIRPHIGPDRNTSPANRATTGTMPKHRNVGR